MRKISKRQKSKISKRDLPEKQLIRQMRAKVKRDPSVIKKFKEYGVPISEIDHVHVCFENLDVSAKTKNKKIYINRGLIGKSDPSAYLAHELVHYLQQSTGNTEGAEVEDYMQKPTEQEAFKTQHDYKENNEGPGKGDKYIEDVLDYHGKDGKERKEIEDKIS